MGDGGLGDAQEGGQVADAQFPKKEGMEELDAGSVPAEFEEDGHFHVLAFGGHLLPYLFHRIGVELLAFLLHVGASAFQTTFDDLFNCHTVIFVVWIANVEAGGLGNPWGIPQAHREAEGYFASLCSRMAARRIFPLTVLGSSATNSMMRGYL